MTQETTPAWQTPGLTEAEHREAVAVYRGVERRCREAVDDPQAQEAAPWFAARADWHSRQAMMMTLGRAA